MIEKDEKPFLDTNILNCSFNWCSEVFYPGLMRYRKVRAGESKAFLFQGRGSCQERVRRENPGHLKLWGI